jgi:oxaloacetate decarboxylase
MASLSYRRNFRVALAQPTCLSPASVYDPLSARIAEAVGFKIGMLAGSVASFTTLAAPDLIVMTLTETAEQVRRIMRASTLGLLIDADHGYGNALSAMRTVEELEHAGAAAVSIEDTLLPQPFRAEKEQVISIAEMEGKLRAAMAARRDPDFAIAGRTSSLRVEGLDGAVQRVRAYATAGVDAIFVVGVDSLEQVRALSEAARLPLILGPNKLDRAALAAEGVAILLQGHQPVAAAAKALHDAYAHLYAGNDPADLAGRIAGNAEMDRLVRVNEFAAFRDRYLK